ncbi:MAG: acylneuraminate cytidylyltransferase family protein [Sulfurimonas sp.]|uniref:acylneuraminate cytidylyltransferase family protein n=1 Tax=Sulfurimonas sp. TaxID=2022749 RepID=UPI002604B8DB|nr:acylneuraminate cytidylyltransferase family protein [Sulfurimonas sp.]MDD5372773.1 acylneuraminate cytidylyltransferase family protein [Sulfurimonas sp.]
MNILALIPARGGSKGVPKKNIKLLEGFPLIGYTIAAAKLSKKINRVIVSTDSEEIAEISCSFGAQAPFLRPSEFAGDKSADIDYVLHTLNWLEKNEDYIPDLIILLRATTPLREVKYIDAAIEEFMKNSEATSLRSSHIAAESPFKWFLIKDNFYTPICDKYTLEDTNKPRQSFPEVYIPNGYVDILKPSFIKQYNSLYGGKILGYVTPNGYEVDTLEEFKYIEYLISKNGSDLLEHLKKNKREHR